MTYLLAWNHPHKPERVYLPVKEWADAERKFAGILQQDGRIVGGAPHIQRPPMRPRLYNDDGLIWNGGYDEQHRPVFVREVD
jgi:hypothetical protein